VLREIKYVQQQRKTDKRRWFTDDDWDVYVWNRKDGSYSGMQLCYAKSRNQRALTWMDGKPPYHATVSEEAGPGNHGKEAAMLVADGTLDIAGLARHFWKVSREIDPEVRKHIIGKLKELMKAGVL
jgi:hypothetical protein